MNPPDRDELDGLDHLIAVAMLWVPVVLVVGLIVATIVIIL
jgi:hypothetical protein